ncbi:MAG TPA: hypothetical protein VFX49_17645 [Chloroflexota bacterium]|nr:hypothetical protein [Chloroflexota bacterium]
MPLRRALAASALGFALLARGALPAHAGETWCDTDPPVVVKTPGGETRVVFVVMAGPAERLVDLLRASTAYEVRPVQGGAATQVELAVTVADPAGQGYAVRSEVWTGPNGTGERLSKRTGRAGAAMRHVFTLNVP